jgi:hypothetical protein
MSAGRWTLSPIACGAGGAFALGVSWMTTAKESPIIYVDFSISGLRMAILRDELARTHRLLRAIVLDNGLKNTGRAMFEWSHKHGVELRFIQQGQTHPECLRRKFHRQIAR